MDTPIHHGTAASDRVFKTASELFAAEGLYQVGVNRIIEEAGVAKATFYRHFPSRNDLVLAYVDGLGRGWASALKEAAGPFATHPADQLLGMFDALARVGRPGDNGGVAFLRAAAESRPGSEVHLKITEHRARILEWITSLARHAEADDPDKLARTLELILAGGQAQEMAAPDVDTHCLARTAAGHVIRAAITRTKPAMPLVLGAA
jgi:AcrR family transcriptional regulator